MLKQIQKIPVTAKSHPFTTAVNACAFEKNGYLEDEYFLYGTANIYDEDAEGKLSIVTPEAPYVNRILVRRPADVSRFSGNVLIEIVNATAGYDIDRVWMLTWKKIVRDGDIFIAVSSKGHIVDALKRFDGERYGQISWANPTPERPGPETGGFDFIQEYELGLFWDMMVDLAKALRTDGPANPIAEYGKNWLYLSGWSQSGSYLARMINTFAYLPENCANGALFDGYFSTGSGAASKPLNSYAASGRMSFGSRLTGASLLCAKEPLIAVNTESENRSTFWYGDFDEPNCKFRTWQIPCSSHDTKYTLLDYYEPMMDDMVKANTIQRWEGYEGEPLNTPYEPIFCAALQALFRWAREGIPAPHAPKIETEMTYEPTDPTGVLVANRKDAFGNALGGIRHPFADCPTGRCQSFTWRKDGSIQQMFGTAYPFSPEKLAALYGTLENYRAQVEKSTDNAIAKGFILPEDREEMIERVVANAAAHGLS